MNYLDDEDFRDFLVDNMPVGIVQDMYEFYKAKRGTDIEVKLVGGLFNSNSNRAIPRPISDEDIDLLTNILKKFNGDLGKWNGRA